MSHKTMDPLINRYSGDPTRIPDRPHIGLPPAEPPRRLPSSTDSAASDDDFHVDLDNATYPTSATASPPNSIIPSMLPSSTTLTAPTIPSSPPRSMPPPPVSLRPTSPRKITRRRNLHQNTTQQVTKRARELALILSDAVSGITHPRNPEASGEAACAAVRALGEFAFESTDAITLLERQEALIEASALRKLIELQSVHLAHTDVQIMALTIWGALRLSEDLPSTKVPKSQAIETIVASLRIHTRNSSLVCEGLRAMHALARLDEVRTEIIARCDGIGVVVDVMVTHDGNEELQTIAARFLAQASYQSETNKTEISMHGALHRLLSAARRFSENRDLQTHVCKTLRNITVKRPDIVSQMTRLNGTWTTVDALVTHKSSYVITLHALAALYHMTTTSTEAIESILRHPGYEQAILGAAQTHEDRANIQTLAFGIAGKAAKAGGALAAKRLVRAGGIKIALNTMHRFVNVRAVMCYGASLVKLLLNEVSGTMDEVQGWGGVDGLVELLYCSVVAPASGNEETIGGYAEVI